LQWNLCRKYLVMFTAIFRQFCCVFLISFLFITNSYAAPACTKKLSMGWEDWKPYQHEVVSADGQKVLTGLDIELMKLIIKHMGCEVKFLEMPWTNLLNGIKRGLIDMAMSASFTEERDKYAYFSQAYRQETMSMFVIKENINKFTFKSLAEIKDSKFTLGIMKAYHYGEAFDKLSKQPEFKKHLDIAGKLELHIKKLQIGRIQGFLDDPAVVTSYLKENKLNKQIVKHPLPINSDNVHIMLSKKSGSEELIKAFDASITALKSGKEYNAILTEYMGSQ
jgi:polar amino acid transport system substrate-binding protein